MTKPLAYLFVILFAVLFLASIAMAVYAIFTFDTILLMINWVAMSVSLYFLLDAMYELRRI